MPGEDDESYSPTHRVRHIVSLHLRNFSPRHGPTPAPTTTALHSLSLGLGSTTDTQPVYLTTPSEPAVHADWTVDPRRIASSSNGRSGIVGQSRFAVSVWARRARNGDGDEADAADAADANWEYSWQVAVDTALLQPIAGGLSSPQLRRLPPNSLIIGIQQQHVRGTHTSAPVAAQPTDQTARRLSAGQANSQSPGTRIKYFLVAPHEVRRRSKSRMRGKDSRHADDSHRGIASERSASEDESEDEDRQRGGYDSETTFELSASHSHTSRSSSHSHTSRPSLSRRRSSSRTVRALKKDRRQKRSTSSAASTPANAAHQQWLLDREREREVLERSKWETTMLGSYTWEALREIVSLQLQLCQESSACKRERTLVDDALQDPSNRFALSRRTSSLHGRLAHLDSLQSKHHDAIRNTQSAINTRRQDLSRRRARLDYVRRSLVARPDHDAEMKQTRSEIARLSIAIHNRRAHLLDVLSFIYPIRLLSGADLLFSICGQALPNSPAESTVHSDEDEVAAALGFTAQLVLLLSCYLDTSLHYEIATAGSKAMIRDGISVMSGPRGFPLYSKGAEQYRFEYAVFLLNKNIEQLMNVHNLPVLDLRHILPNLNNLILTLSSRVAEEQPASRRAYKMVGKGEILLPSGSGGRERNGAGDGKGGTALRIGGGESVGEGNGEIELRHGGSNTVDKTPIVDTTTSTHTSTQTPSMALSWTASLFGRSSRQRERERAAADGG